MLGLISFPAQGGSTALTPTAATVQAATSQPASAQLGILKTAQPLPATLWATQPEANVAAPALPAGLAISPQTAAAPSPNGIADQSLKVPPPAPKNAPDQNLAFNPDPNAAGNQAQTQTGLGPQATASLSATNQSIAPAASATASPASSNTNSVNPTSGLSPNTLAFAMRVGAAAPGPIQPAEISKASGESETPALPGLTGAPEAGLLNAIAAAAQPQSEHHSQSSDGSAGNPYAGSPLAEIRPLSTDAPAFAEQTSSVNSTQSQDAVSAATNDPVQNVLLQLKGDDNRRVDVRLIDRGGELHVSVKSADPDLAQRLQDHMPDLTSRLDAQRLTSQVWMPKLNESSQSDSGRSSSSGGSGTNTQPDGASGGRQQQNSQSQSRPDWVDLLENQIS